MELSLREIQMESLSILKDIKKICEREGITYYLAWGTLLGAVRHNGFIPWDDDVDIMMPRKDYERFIDYCTVNSSSLLPYQLMHYTTNDRYVYVLARFTNTNFRVDYKGTQDYGLGTFVDIYPLDGLGDHYKDACKNMKKNYPYMKMIKFLTMGKFERSKSIGKTIVKYPLYLIAKSIGRKRLIENFDLKCKSISYENSQYVGIPTVETMESCIIKKEWLSESVMHKFEDEDFPIPAMYDELLTHRYGKYMNLPPKEQQIAHHFYSVYRK